MAIDPKFIIQQQGRDFVLFAGLLDEAHVRGLKSITTEVVKLVMDGDTPAFALVKARVEMEGGGVYEGYGDANTSNVNRNVGKHLVRMAETRAKARALRDAVNIGTTAFDEIGGDDEASPGANTQKPRDGSKRPTPAQRPASEGPDTNLSSTDDSGGSGERITPEQRRRITELAQDFYSGGLRELQMKILKGQQIAKLNQKNAQKLIGGLEFEIKTRDDALATRATGDPGGGESDDVGFDEDDFDDIERMANGTLG